MSCSPLITETLVGLLFWFAGLPGVVPTDSPQEKFYKAYYFDSSAGDCAAAADLYRQVADDGRAEDALRSQAKAALAACREELAGSDFARLMPPEVWAYVEINRPGDHVEELLRKLGLLADGRTAVAEGQRRLAISPALIRQVLGIGGAAVAVTGFNPMKKAPSGVLIFHPGDVEVVRGLIETGLPVGGRAVAPIGGFATYDLDGKVLVTLTSRFVVVSAEQNQIQGVVDRLSGKDETSLATNPAVAGAVENRDGSFLFVFVNAKAMMPMIKGMMALGAMANRELAMSQALLDLDSLNSLTGRLGLNGRGISFDLGLRLDPGHHNLVYNFFRTPAIDHGTLEWIPDGAAAFVSGALNEAGSRYASSPHTDGPPVVTALDFGREIFANITSFAIFVMPPGGSSAEGGTYIPDAAAVITVNEPAKSQALWSQILGIASFASGGPAVEGASVDVDGVTVRSYQFPDSVTIYLGTMDGDVLIASSKAAISRSILAKREGRSVLHDESFGATLSRLRAESTKAVFVHAGRCAQIAKAFMSRQEAAEVEPFVSVLSETVASLVVDYSSEVFHVSFALSAVPNVGDLVAKMLTAQADQRNGGKTRARPGS